MCSGLCNTATVQAVLGRGESGFKAEKIIWEGDRLKEIMKNTNSLILGIDLCNEFSQVCYYDVKTQKSESVPVSGTGMICKNPIPLDVIFESMNEGLPIQMNELSKLIGYLLDSAKKYRKCPEIQRICVAVEDFNITLLDVLKTAFEINGYKSDMVTFISHEEAYAYYAFSMKRELWNGGVILLDYTDRGINSIELANVKIKNSEIIVEEQLLFDDAQLQQVISGDKTLDEIDGLLETIGMQILNGRVISSIYLTGSGFNTDKLPPRFLKCICNRHRVFAGQNLYVKGACFAAYEELDQSRFANTIFACKNRITTGIEVGILERGKNKVLRVVKPGINWYEAGRTLEFIVDDCSEIRLNMIPVAKKESYEELIDFGEFPYRANKTTKIRVEFEFTADDRCLVTVKDKGFGEIARSSDKVIYKNLEL